MVLIVETDKLFWRKNVTLHTKFHTEKTILKNVTAATSYLMLTTLTALEAKNTYIFSEKILLSNFTKQNRPAHLPISVQTVVSPRRLLYRGYYTVATRYEFFVRVARTISHE